LCTSNDSQLLVTSWESGQGGSVDRSSKGWLELPLEAFLPSNLWDLEIKSLL
jgi:hypothetical protein